MSFKPGDEVLIITGTEPAIVLEQDGDRVYIELNNGAEMEYGASALILASDYVSPAEKAQREKEDKQIELAVKMGYVWDAIDPNLQAMTKLYHQDITNILSVFGPGTKAASPWDDVNSLQRLNILAVLTSIPVAMWIDAYVEDKMSRLTMVAYADIAKHHEENNYGV